MAKTIKQIADELGVSKTSVMNKIDNLGLRSSLRKIANQFAIDDEQEMLIKSAFSQKESQTKNANPVGDSSQTLRLLSDMVCVLSEQLKEKDKQIERLQTELENAQKSVDQAQQLHAMTEQKIRLLEQKEQEETEEIHKKPWWKFGK